MRLYDLITKDVKAENETKRVIVALRILYIIVFIAFSIDLLLVGKENIKAFSHALPVLFIANIALFIHTYYSKTKPALFCFMIFLFIWILQMIPFLGWSAGMQNYFIIILMLCFFAMYGKPSYKFLYAGFVLGMRIMTIWAYGGIKPLFEFNAIRDKHLQITNISAVFISIIFISYVFSQKENEAEHKLMQYNDKLKQEAGTDQLTGLSNRSRAQEQLHEMKQSGETAAMSIAMGDIDFFKKVNDTYGHDAGDEVLKFVAKTMIDNCRNDSIIARWGGEEFLLVFPNTNGDNAYIALERLRKKIQDTPIKINDMEISITMTFGLTEYSFSDDESYAIKEADEKLYMGKQNGRNQVVY